MRPFVALGAAFVVAVAILIASEIASASTIVAFGVAGGLTFWLSLALALSDVTVYSDQVSFRNLIYRYDVPLALVRGVTTTSGLRLELTSGRRVLVGAFARRMAGGTFSPYEAENVATLVLGALQDKRFNDNPESVVTRRTRWLSLLLCCVGTACYIGVLFAVAKS